MSGTADHCTDVKTEGTFVGFRSVLTFAHRLVAEAVRPGECAIDATAGGGNDTAFLARLVGPGGTVYAFDIQEEALRRTEARLVRDGWPESAIRFMRADAVNTEDAADAGAAGEPPPQSGLPGPDTGPLREGPEPEGPGIWLLQGSHHRMADMLPGGIRGKAAAVMFNLGYLPRGNPSIMTRMETTLPALEAATALLRPDGVLTCVVYPGHEGGDEEAAAVEAWAAALDAKRFQAILYRPLNRLNRPPYLIAARKLAARREAGGESTEP